MTSRRTLIALGTGLLAAALVVPSSAGAATGLRAGSTSVAAALPPLGSGDWTGARNKVAGGGWNQAETTIGTANAASLHVARTYPGVDNSYGGQSGATGHGMFYAGRSGGGIVAYDEATGAVRWSATTGSMQLAVGDRAVFTVTGGDGLPGSGPGSITAYDAGTGARLWHKAIANVLNIAPPTLSGSRVLVAWNGQAGRLGPSYVASYDIATGRKMWQQKLPNVGGAGWPYRVSAVSAQDGVGVVTIADGSAAAFDLGSGALLWKLNVGGLTAGLTQSRPVIRDGLVYLALSYSGGSSGVVKALRLTTGVQSWSRDFVGGPFTGLTEAAGVLYLGLDVEGLPAGTQDLYALRSADGGTIWSREIGSVGTPPTIANGVLYVSPVLGGTRLMTLAAATGATLGTVPLAFDDFGEAAISHGRVYVYEGNGPIAVLTP